MSQEAVGLLRKIKQLWVETPNERHFSIGFSKLLPELQKLITPVPSEPEFKPRKFRWGLNEKDVLIFNEESSLVKCRDGFIWNLSSVLNVPLWIEVPYEAQH